jgi:hypothetical protein
MRKLAILALAFALYCGAVFAATTPNSFVTPQTPNRGLVRFVQGTDAPAVFKTLYTAGANGSRCYAMWLTSNDAVSHGIFVGVFNSGNQFGGISINSGTTAPGYSNGNPPLTLFSTTVWGSSLPIDQYGNSYLQLNNGDTIQAEYTGALTASTQINIIAICSDF